MEGRRQVVLLWLALVCFLACAVLHVSSAPAAAAAGNADAGEGDSHASTWPRSWAKEKMVEKLSTLTDVSARSSEDDGHRNVKETALDTRDERDPSAEDVTNLAYEQYEASKDTVSGIAGKASEIAKKIYETLRNTAALGVIGKTGKALAKGSYDAVKDAVAATSAKTGEREKYTTEKVADVAIGTSGTAKKVTYDATTAKAQELGATVSQKAKETVNAAAETGKKAYRAAAQNSKAALDVIMETATKSELVLEQALTTIRAAAELGKKMMNLKLKMMKCKVEETPSDAATKQTKNEAEAAAEQAKKSYELAIEKTQEAAEAASGTLPEQTYDDATTGKVYRTSVEARIEQAKAKYAEAKGAASKMAAETGEKLKNLEGEHEEL